MLCDKVRIRFRKTGDLRLVSHHDLMRCWERMLRRADLPYHSTSGFNPKPRLIFALSLGLGIVGCEEVAELELTAELPPEEVHDRLRQQAPIGLDIVTCSRVPIRANAQVRRVTYRIDLLPSPLGGEGLGVRGKPLAPIGETQRAEPLPSPPAPLPQGERGAEARQRADDLLAAPEVWTERTHPQPRKVNIRPYLDAFRVEAAAVEMDIWVTPNGTARPDEVLTLLGLGDLLAGGAVLQRTRLEIDDELPPDIRIPPTTTHTPERAGPAGVGPGVASPGKPSGHAASEKRPEPLLPGPMDY